MLSNFAWLALLFWPLSPESKMILIHAAYKPIFPNNTQPPSAVIPFQYFNYNTPCWRQSINFLLHAVESWSPAEGISQRAQKQAHPL